MKKCKHCFAEFVLENGKNKGKTLAQVPDSYLEWLVTTTNLSLLVEEYRWHKSGHKFESVPDHVLTRILYGNT